jgi:hypothetical protein
MMDIGVVKSPNYLQDRIDRADMREELIPESLPFRGTLDETCDIDEFDIGRDCLCAVHHNTDLFETVIIHIHDTSIGFDRTKRKIRCLSRIGLSESIEESGFTNIRESDDTNLHGEKYKK